MLTYINLITTDTFHQTKWTLFTYLDDLSHLGGLRVVFFAIVGVLVNIFTYKIHQIRIQYQNYIIERHVKEKWKKIDGRK